MQMFVFHRKYIGNPAQELSLLREFNVNAPCFGATPSNANHAHDANFPWTSCSDAQVLQGVFIA